MPATYEIDPRDANGAATDESNASTFHITHLGSVVAKASSLDLARRIIKWFEELEELNKMGIHVEPDTIPAEILMHQNEFIEVFTSQAKIFAIKLDFKLASKEQSNSIRAKFKLSKP